MRFFSPLLKFFSFKKPSLKLIEAFKSQAIILFLWIWNGVPGQTWYFDIRFDKHIFWSFSWIVWVGFMRRFGGSILPYVTWYQRNFEVKLINQTLLIWESFEKTDNLTPTLNFQSELDLQIFPSFNQIISNPNKDIDLTVSTDCEDLAAFGNDVLEFVEQDRALLVDSLTDFGITSIAIVSLFGGAKILSSRILKKKK